MRAALIALVVAVVSIGAWGQASPVTGNESQPPAFATLPLCQNIANPTYKTAYKTTAPVGMYDCVAGVWTIHGTGSGTISGLNTNKVPKASNATTIIDSLCTEDATTFTCTNSGGGSFAAVTTTGAATRDKYTEIVAPATPNAGFGYTWFDSTNHRFNECNSSATCGTTVVALTCAAHQFFNSITAAGGVVNCAQPAISDLTTFNSAALATALTDEVGAGVVILPPAPGAGDQIIQTTTNSTTLGAVSVPNCPGGTGYSTASHAFVCTLGSAMVGTTTAVTVAVATAADQNLQTIASIGGTLSTVGRHVHLHSDGSYTTGASGNGTMTFKVKMCTVSGCGSGTVNTLATFGPTAAASISATAMPWSIELDCFTTTSGASGVLRCGGTLTTVLGTTPTALGGTYQSASLSIASSDTTVTENWQITVADAGNSANNSTTGNTEALNWLN